MHNGGWETLFTVVCRPVTVFQALELVRLVQNMRQGAGDHGACKARDAREQEGGSVEAVVQEVVAQRACGRNEGLGDIVELSMRSRGLRTDFLHACLAHRR